MTFSKEWEEKQYAKGRQFVLYPFSDLVSLVSRMMRDGDLPEHPRVLEIGCGTGPNIPFFLNQGCEYCGLDGAQSAVSFVGDRFGNQVDVRCHDFCEQWPFGDSLFDLVFDRSAVNHNRTEHIPAILEEARRMLHPGGCFLGVDWFSTDSQLYKNNGKQDLYTPSYGVYHFFTQEEIQKLFGESWDLFYLRHKQKQQILPEDSYSSHFDLIARKK